MYHVLYNPNAGGGTGEENVKKVSKFIEGEYVKNDMTKVNYEEFFKNLGKDDKVVVCGGDGTLHRFINEAAPYRKDTPILYYAMGSGNDFMHDIGIEPDTCLVELNKYLENLPQVTVNGETCYYLNNVSFGLDGYCCEMGDIARQKSTKPVNYTAIAIKGLLFGFKRKNAKITIDGKTESFSDVWLAPTMKGRYCGGGMMLAPGQDRLNKDNSVTLLVFHCPSKLKTLIVFPSVFKGEHIKHTEMCKVYEGHDVFVEFDEPCSLQIDGETRLNVKNYTVKA